MSEKKTKGGARVGAGRKSLENKKRPVTIYVTTEKIEEHGGEDKLKEGLITYISGNPISRDTWEQTDMDENKIITPLKFSKPEHKKAKADVIKSIINYKVPTPENYDADKQEKWQLQDEFGQMGSNNPIPIRGKDEDAIDFAARKNAWKRSQG